MAKKKKTTIDKLARDCKVAFEELEADVESSEGQDVSDEKARFNIWMDSVMPDTFFGISRLDYQLRDSESLRSKVVTLLRKLIRILKQAREPDTEEVDSVLSDQEITDDLGSQRVPDQARQIHRARRVIDLLLRLTGTVKRPAPDDQIKFAALNTADESSHDLDVEQVQAQFPGVPPYLAERLGKAIWKRRQYFVYKLGSKERPVDNQEAPKDNAVSNGVSASDGHGRNASNEEFALAPLGAELELDKWEGPTEGLPFSCPVCSEVFNPSDLDFWLDHLEDDLRAYLCTWEDCCSGPHMYTRRKDWQRHEETVHRRTWTCPFECDSTFERADDLSDHLHATHRKESDPEILKSLIEASSRPSEPSEVLRCPLCEARITTMDRFYRHVGEHLHYLSYFSLPARLVRERPETDTESVDSVSSSVVEGLSEHGDDASGKGVIEQRDADAYPRQAIVESDDAEHLSDKAPEAGAPVAVDELEIFEIDETPVEETKEKDGNASQRESTTTPERSRERSPARLDFAPGSRKVLERSRSRESVIEILRYDGEPRRWDRERFERSEHSKSAQEEKEEDDLWGTFGTSSKDKKNKKTKKKTGFDLGWSDEPAEPPVDVAAPAPAERISIDKTEIIIRDRVPSPVSRERVVFRERDTTHTRSGETEDIDDRIRRRTPSPSPPPGDRVVYRERERAPRRPVGKEEIIIRRRESFSLSPPARQRYTTVRRYHPGDEERDIRDESEGPETETAKAKDGQTSSRGERQYEEFAHEYRAREATKELERKQVEARIEREYAERRANIERERAEMEERIRMELKKKEAERKHDEERTERKVDEVMRKRLAAFGFTDRQIRSIVKGDDKSEGIKPGFEAREPFRERQREYHEPSQVPVREREYYPYSRDYAYPPREHRVGERASSRPSRRHYVESEDDLEPIRFEDAEYRRYKLPFKAARTWKGMQKAIREIYQNSDARDMDEDIISGRYQMLDADDNGILPSTWEMVVKPGHVYKLAFTRSPNHDRSYDRDRSHEAPVRRDNTLDEFLEAEEAAKHRQRRRSQSPIIIRETAIDPETRHSAPPPPPPPDQNPFHPPADNPFQPVNVPLSRPLEPRHQSDTSGGMRYYGDDEFDFYRRPRRARSTKAVSFEPYIDDETGWYPSLETATRGGFKRPAREAEYRPRYRNEPHHAALYAHPSPPPRTASIQRHVPTWMKAHRDHVAPETLKYYDLPWEYDKNDPSYVLIQRDMAPHETEILFEHTRRLKDRPAVIAGPSSQKEVEIVRA